MTTPPLPHRNRTTAGRTKIPDDAVLVPGELVIWGNGSPTNALPMRVVRVVGQHHDLDREIFCDDDPKICYDISALYYPTDEEKDAYYAWESRAPIQMIHAALWKHGMTLFRVHSHQIPTHDWCSINGAALLGVEWIGKHALDVDRRRLAQNDALW